MSHDSRLAAWPYGAPNDDDDAYERKGGSVRAARQRLHAAQNQGRLPDRSRIVGLPQRPNQLVSQFSSQNRYPPQQQQQQQQDPRRGEGGSDANAPSPTPQWPLANDLDDVLDSQPRQYLRPPNRGPPPQRPPRPTSDELPIQPNSPGYHESYQSDEMFSPASAQSSSRPLTTSSAASESSSLGSIPDFPAPQPPMPTLQPLPRRAPSLGPPPSARRGPPSYYTQTSYVSPIAEEAETRSDTIRSHHGSFASSNVIPAHCDGIYDNTIPSDDEETITSDYGRESRASDHDDSSGLVTPALVREASLCRRTKPSIMTIKSMDSLGEKKGTPERTNSDEDDGTGVGAAGIGGAMLAARDGLGGQARRPSPCLSNGTGLIDDSSSESLDEKERYGSPESQRAFTDLEKELETSAFQQETRQPKLADRVGKRRPPRIDVDAVRDAEARGSLTSLPELIRRATRLAANLDRGKTASRLGLDFWEAGAPDKANARKSGSLSDMLAAFPPPGDATPVRGGTPNPANLSMWPNSRLRDGRSNSVVSDGGSSEKRRRCCGMPLWTFVTLFIVLLFLVAAAVIIPVALIVLPNMRDSQANAQAQSSGNDNNSNDSNNSDSAPAAAPTMGAQSGQCDGAITCQNGGVAILNSDRTCNCVCINGFTGTNCGDQGDSGCTTTSAMGTVDNATVGSGIPRLIEASEETFNVPLDSSRLLSVFSSLDLSCTAENALITFNGLASRSTQRKFMPIIVERSIEPTRPLAVLNAPHPAGHSRHLNQRQAIGEPGVADAQDTNDSSPSSSAEPSATPTQPVSSNANAVDFARIGVLLALQESGELDTAANAQEKIQDFLADNRNGDSNRDSVDVGPFSIDLVNFAIEFQNGTTIEAQS